MYALRKDGATRNIAFKKESFQVDTYGFGKAANAVDGDTNGKWNGKSCTHTTSKDVAQGNNWWAVDLGKKELISLVVLHNRADCCGR